MATEKEILDKVAEEIANDLDKEVLAATGGEQPTVEVLEADTDGTPLRVRTWTGNFSFEYRTPEGIERSYPVEVAQEFEPELGQMAFSGSPWAQWGLSRSVYVFIRDLCAKLDEIKDKNPCGNTGDVYENEVFSMRAYCWCDGERHPEGCPPNFKCGDFEVRWYKYFARGCSMNKNIGEEELAALAARCYASIREESP